MISVIYKFVVKGNYMVGTLVTVPRIVDVSKGISFRVVEIRHKNNVEVNFGYLAITKERYLEIREAGFREHD